MLCGKAAFFLKRRAGALIPAKKNAGCSEVFLKTACKFLEHRLLSLRFLQIMNPQSPNRVQDRDDHNAHIGKNGEPHIGDAECAEPEAGKFNHECKYNVLVDDRQTFSGNFNEIGRASWRERV